MPRKPKPKKRTQRTTPAPLPVGGPELVKLVPVKTGRPRVDLTEAGWEQVKLWASAGASQEEIADALGISRRTFTAPHMRENFERITLQAWAARKIKLRAKIIEAAEEQPGRRAAQKLMGPVLGWHDRVEMTGAQGGPVEFVTANREQALESIKAALARLREKRSGKGTA